MVVSVDTFNGQGMNVARHEEEEEENDNRIRTPNTARRTTHVICSSRSALFLRSRFENNLNFKN